MLAQGGQYARVNREHINELYVENRAPSVQFQTYYDNEGTPPSAKLKLPSPRSPPPHRPGPGHASRPRLRSSVIQQQRRDFDTLVESHRTVRGLVLQPRLGIDARR